MVLDFDRVTSFACRKSERYFFVKGSLKYEFVQHFIATPSHSSKNLRSYLDSKFFHGFLFWSQDQQRLVRCGYLCSAIQAVLTIVQVYIYIYIFL